jgi:hypothetical protein
MDSRRWRCGRWPSDLPSLLNLPFVVGAEEGIIVTQQQSADGDRSPNGVAGELSDSTADEPAVDDPWDGFALDDSVFRTALRRDGR